MVYEKISGREWTTKDGKKFLIYVHEGFQTFIPLEVLIDSGDEYLIDTEALKTYLERKKPVPKTQLEVLKEISEKLDKILAEIKPKN